MMNDSIGIDISRDRLDAFRLSDKALRAFANTPAGFGSLRRWLGDTPINRIVYEATGPYHSAFECALAFDLPLVKVNPLRARRLAQARGSRARTGHQAIHIDRLMINALIAARCAVP